MHSIRPTLSSNRSRACRICAGCKSKQGLLFWPDRLIRPKLPAMLERNPSPTDQSDASNRRRSQRVLLQVAVVIRAETPEGKRMQAQGFTSSVNAHGGLLESPLKVVVNQRITIVNPHTGKEAGGRAVGVERASSELFSVAFEFDRPSPQFWPITLSP